MGVFKEDVLFVEIQEFQMHIIVLNVHEYFKRRFFAPVILKAVRKTHIQIFFYHDSIDNLAKLVKKTYLAYEKRHFHSVFRPL